MDCKRALADAGGDVAKAVVLLRERGLAKAGKREGRATSEGAVAIALAGPAGGMVEVGCETDFVARTDDFSDLVETLARAVAEDASLTSPDSLLAARLDGETVRERVTQTISRVGENVVVKRVARLTAEGGGVTGGYVHAGGKLGVLVALRATGTGPELETLAKDVAMHVAAADPTPLSVDRSGVSDEHLASERQIYRRQALQEGKPEKVVDRIVQGKVEKYLKDVVLLEQAFVKDADKTVGEIVRERGAKHGAEVAAFARFKLGETDAS
jgi:elongation factor Ts